MKRILIVLSGGLALFAIFIVSGMAVLNQRLIVQDSWIGQSVAQIEEDLGPSIRLDPDAVVWYRDISLFGFPLMVKGVQVDLHSEFQDDGQWEIYATEYQSYWIFNNFLHVNMVYEPGFKPGIFCFTKHKRCDFW